MTTGAGGCGGVCSYEAGGTTQSKDLDLQTENSPTQCCWWQSCDCWSENRNLDWLSCSSRRCFFTGNCLLWGFVFPAVTFSFVFSVFLCLRHQRHMQEVKIETDRVQDVYFMNQGCSAGITALWDVGGGENPHAAGLSCSSSSSQSSGRPRLSSPRSFLIIKGSVLRKLQSALHVYFYRGSRKYPTTSCLAAPLLEETPLCGGELDPFCPLWSVGRWREEPRADPDLLQDPVCAE